MPFKGAWMGLMRAERRPSRRRPQRSLEQLGRITGAVTPDDLLDHIFGNFCIGK